MGDYGNWMYEKDLLENKLDAKGRLQMNFCQNNSISDKCSHDSVKLLVKISRKV